MGRPTKLDAKLQKMIVAGLKTGATVVDVCAAVGLGQSTFYEWRAIGQAVIDGEPHDRMPDDQAERARFAEFVDTITRAEGDAKRAAIKTLRSAMEPYKEKQKTIRTFSEKRTDKDGHEIEYTETTTTDSTITRAGDWRAAVEYLKRRHFDEWGDKSKAEHSGEIRIKTADDFSDDELARIAAGSGGGAAETA